MNGYSLASCEILPSDLPGPLKDLQCPHQSPAPSSWHYFSDCVFVTGWTHKIQKPCQWGGLMHLCVLQASRDAARRRLWRWVT